MNENLNNEHEFEKVLSLRDKKGFVIVLFTKLESLQDSNNEC
jgi:hypothetical protein